MTQTRTRRWPKILLGLVVVLVLLVVGAYFLLTSSAFIKGVVLPRVSDSMEADITVRSISLKPFSRVEITDLKVQPRGHEPLVQAGHVIARYDLREILNGNILVHEVTLDKPLITLVEDERGSNLEKITGEEKAEEKKEPTKLNISNVKINEGTIVLTEVNKEGGKETTTINNLNLTVDKVASGGSGNLTLNGNLTQVENSKETNGTLSAKIDGKIKFALTSDNLPQSANGGINVTVNQAQGSYQQVNGLAIALQTDLTPTEIRNLALRFSKGGTALGELAVSGPFNAEKKEGNLNVALKGIDRQVLNLAAAGSNMDLNKTTISSTNQIQLSNGGQSITVDGKLQAADFSLTDKEKNQTTPVVNLSADYRLALNQQTSAKTIERFNLTGTQNGREFLRGFINNPLTLTTNAGSNLPDSSLTLYLTNFALADWKAFASDLNPSGNLNAGLTLNSTKGGNQLNLDLLARIAGLQATIGSNKVNGADITALTKATITNLNQIGLQQLQVTMGQQNNEALRLTATGLLNKETEDTDLRVDLNSSLPQLSRILSITNLNFTEGLVAYTGKILQQKQKQTVQGQLTVSNLSGTVSEAKLDRLVARMDVDLSKDNDLLDIRTLKGNLAHGGNPSGDFEVKGNLNSADTKGTIDFQLRQLNEHLLRPFMASTLGEKQLVSININAQGSAQLNGTNDMRLKGDFDLSNFVIKDPAKPQADPALSVKLTLNGSQRNQVFELQDSRLKLSPTERAQNELQIRGMLDMSRSNALKGNLVLSSEGLDVTPFYDIYAGKPGETNKPAAGPAGPATPPEKKEEPGPTTLPVDNLVAEINISKFYLRQVDVTGLQAKALVQSNRLTLNPVQMTMNNAPVSASVDLNLGVKGYGYDIAFKMDRVPLDPLAVSFSDVKPGQYQGQLIADVKVKGIGTTGTSLKQHLTGSTLFSFTNANIELVGPKWRRILTPITIILRANDLLESPLNWVNAQMQFGNGNINLQTAGVQSEAFQATVQGIIPISDELTNSPLNKLPVNFQLRRSLAEKIGVLAANTPQEAKYSPLPSFVSLTGTIGQPTTDINELALTGVLLKGGAGIIRGTAGDVLQGVGGLLTGQRPAATQTNAPGTNAAGTNAAPATNNAPLNPLSPLRDLFRRK